MQTTNLNVAILGPTGVGKSSLINYLFDDQKLRESGAGKPVTEKGFFMSQKTVNNIPINLIDSWGIENGKTGEWEAYLKEFMEAHDVKKEIKEWIHIAMYCISAASDRVQDYDIQTIKHMLKENIEVVIVLTKAGRSSQEAVEQMKETILNELNDNNVQVKVVNSVKETMMNGFTIEQFGKKELFEAFQLNYLEMLRKRLPDRILSVLHTTLDRYQSDIATQEKRKEAASKAEQLHQQFWEVDVEETIKEEIQQALHLYAQTIAIELDEDVFKTDDYTFNFKKVFKDILVKLGIARIVGTVLGGLVPAIGILMAATTVFTAIKAFLNQNKSADEIAAIFKSKNEAQLQEVTGKIRQSITTIIDEIEQSTKEVKQISTTA